MHPELFTIGSITIHTYGFMIMLGALAAYTYGSKTAQKELNINPDKIQTLAILIIATAFVGGKLFFYFEKPGYYFGNPINMVNSFRQGFVFYGSLLFAVPTVIWYFRKEKWPVWPVMDLMAIVAPIIHGFGRLGCFFAGCCYGVPTDSILGVVFTDEISQAKPLHTALHPTQLYEFVLISSILLVLVQLKRKQKFEGQLFFVYIILYATGRSITEMFRGDLRRGFIIEDLLSHSQFISIVLIIITILAYRRFSRKRRISS